MMEKYVDANGSGNNGGREQTAGPVQHAKPNTLPGQERQAKEGEKSCLSHAEHSLRADAPPGANDAAHQRVDAKAPSREPDRHENRHTYLCTATHDEHGGDSKH